MTSKSFNPAEVLRRCGYRATPGRIALLTVLAREEEPLTVEEIGKRLKGRLNPVTLYRALEALSGAGVVRAVDFAHGHTHYELLEGKTHHHHVVCNTCGAVEDIESPLLERAVAAAAKGSHNFSTIYSHNLEFFGSCKSCA